MAVRLVGVEKMQGESRRLAHRFPELAAQALNREAEEIMTEAKTRTPVRDGHLRRSGKVSTKQKGREIRSTLSFGNVAVFYAARQHEDLELHHTVGEAKFLERPLKSALRGMVNRLTRDMQVEKL